MKKAIIKSKMRHLSMMAILCMGGMIMSGCSDNDMIVDEPQQPVNRDNVVTLTTTVSFDEATATTRALTEHGVKTFAAGDQIAVVYKNTENDYAKAVSQPLKSSNIAADGKSATFSVTLTNPKGDGEVNYYYPATMITDDFQLNYDALASQDGTLTTLGSALDFSWGWGDMTAEYELPASVKLTNMLAIVKLTVKNSAGTDITGSITQLTLEYPGVKTYTVTRTAAPGPIYVAVHPVNIQDIRFTATDGEDSYVKSVSRKTLEMGNLYPISLTMDLDIPEGALPGKFTVTDNGRRVRFAKGNLQATTSDYGQHWTWSFAEHQWECIGTDNATINGNGTVSTNGTVDLFGWSSDAEGNYFGISNSTSTSAEFYGGTFVDWGTNAITNGGNTPKLWRTMSASEPNGEWNYLCNMRTTTTNLDTENARYAKAQVNAMHGVILFPDKYTHPAGVAVPAGINEQGDTGWNNNSYSVEDWAKMEAAGCVFLPAAGSRYGTFGVDYVNKYGSYSSSWGGNGSVRTVYFKEDGLSAFASTFGNNGIAVRLVTDVK